MDELCQLQDSIGGLAKSVGIAIKRVQNRDPSSMERHQSCCRIDVGHYRVISIFASGSVEQIRDFGKTNFYYPGRSKCLEEDDEGTILKDASVSLIHESLTLFLYRNTFFVDQSKGNGLVGAACLDYVQLDANP